MCSSLSKKFWPPRAARRTSIFLRRVLLTKCVQIFFGLQIGLPTGLHLVNSCENSKYQTVQVGDNSYDVGPARAYVNTCTYHMRKTPFVVRVNKHTQR